jgi:hypothetical protein
MWLPQLRALGLLLGCGAVLAVAGCDASYVLRVVSHRDSHTDDYTWKHTVTLPAAAAPVVWRESPACGAVEAAFAADGDVPPLPEYLAQGGALAFVVVRDGAHGQILLVSRAGRTVIVRLGRDGHNGSRGLGFDGHGETNISIAKRFQRVAERLR